MRKQLKQINTEEKRSQGQRVYDTGGISCQLTALGGGQGAKTGLYLIPEATTQGFAVAGEGDSINLSQPNSKTRRGRVGVANTIDTQMQQYTPVIYDDYNSRIRKDGNACTLTANSGSNANRNGQKVLANMKIRRLTPMECERLQGFPDDWTKYGHDGKEISDSQRYKMMGNSVSVPVVKTVMEKLIKEGELR